MDYSMLKSHLGHRVSCRRKVGGIIEVVCGCGTVFASAVKPVKPKKPSKDRRWKICLSCMGSWADRYATNRNVADGWKKRYKRKVRKWVSNMKHKRSSRLAWTKPCRGKCDRVLEFTVIGQEGL